MKYFIYTLFFCLFASIAVAQNHSKEVQFINEFIAQKNIDEIESINKLFKAKSTTPKAIVRNDIFYQDSVGINNIKNLKKGLIIRGNVLHKARQDSLIYIDSVGRLTVLPKKDAEDLAHANMRSKKHIRFRLEEMLGDSLVITEKESAYINVEIDKMRQFTWGKNEFLNMKFIATDTVKKIFADVKHTGWEEMNKRGVNRLYNFSKPIFFHNDTYCLFYYGYGCGWLCGEGRVAIYKKQAGKWVVFSILSGWVS